MCVFFSVHCHNAFYRAPDATSKMGMMGCNVKKKPEQLGFIISLEAKWVVGIACLGGLRPHGRKLSKRLMLYRPTEQDIKGNNNWNMCLLLSLPSILVRTRVTVKARRRNILLMVVG